MRQRLIEAGLSTQVKVDSAGLIDYHEGELPDSRMRHHAALHGYELTHRSRPVRREDFLHFDLIIGMDDANIRRLQSLAPSDEARRKIHKMTEFCRSHQVSSVPDPYYGGSSDFEYVIEILEDATQGLLDSLVFAV